MLASMSGIDRLSHLLSLADQGPAMRAALAEEVAELLINWPADCPLEMHGACEALLARAVRDVDADTRARVRIRLYADPDLSARVLPPEAHDNALLEAARAGEAVAPRLARTLGLSESVANEILRDQSGRALAAIAKAMGLNRATFSALTLLAQPSTDLKACYARLDVFDAMTATEASREVQHWSERQAA